MREKFFRLGEDNDITDESGNPVFRVDGKALSLRDLMVVQDLQGIEVARVHRKLASMLPQYGFVFGIASRPRLSTLLGFLKEPVASRAAYGSRGDQGQNCPSTAAICSPGTPTQPGRTGCPAACTSPRLAGRAS